MFGKFVSNVPIGTGNNYIIEMGRTVKLRARAFFRPNVYGDFLWRFYFSNTVDSTFADGKTAYRNKSGGNWRINSASIASAADNDDEAASLISAELANVTPVLFDGSASRNVKPDERFWSDIIQFKAERGKYLVWEWELEGDGIPFTPDSQVPTFCDWGDGYRFTIDCPMPAMLGCSRTVKKMIAFAGDSITQGCATTINKYEMWAAKISYALGEDYSVWNLGLGYARGSDFASNGAWLDKARHCDAAVITFGVNDLITGAYGAGRGDTADELLSSLERIIRLLQESGVQVILSTIPPFVFTDEQYAEWKKANLAIPALAEKYGLALFDIERALDASPNLGNIYTYGAHPNSDGGDAAAKKFMESAIF